MRSRCGTVLACAALALALAAACAPALDWREWRTATPAGAASLVAWLPCRPRDSTRTLPLAGRPVTLTLQRCDAGGAVWAVAWADVGDPGQVEPALRALRSAALANIGASAPTVQAPAKVSGQTPQPEALRWLAAGHLPDGRAVFARSAVFAHGTTVWQASVVGPALDAEADASFFGGLRFALQ